MAYADNTTTLADVIVPELFNPYVQLQTTQKSRLVASGALRIDPALNTFLAGEGLTVQARAFKDLDDSEENLSTDNGPNSTPHKIGSVSGTAVRLSRNNSWASADLVASMIDPDPMAAIGNRVGAYWTRRLQAAYIATVKGVFANNATATDEYHVQNDMTHDISGAGFSAGVTSFSAEAFIDATLTMGDSLEDLTAVCVHSIVYGRMLKNNLIDFIPDATNPGAQGIPTFLGRMVIVDDAMPMPGAGVFETWLMSQGCFGLGTGAPKVPTEVKRNPEANNGAGDEILHNRVEWCIHPVGYSYIGTPAVSGPSNAATVNNLANAGSWRRFYTERKMIKMARLITREF